MRKSSHCIVVTTCSKFVYFRVIFRAVLLCGESEIKQNLHFYLPAGNENRAQKIKNYYASSYLPQLISV